MQRMLKSEVWGDFVLGRSILTHRDWLGLSQSVTPSSDSRSLWHRLALRRTALWHRLDAQSEELTQMQQFQSQLDWIPQKIPSHVHIWKKSFKGFNFVSKSHKKVELIVALRNIHKTYVFLQSGESPVETL